MVTAARDQRRDAAPFVLPGPAACAAAHGRGTGRPISRTALGRDTKASRGRLFTYSGTFRVRGERLNSPALGI